MLARVPPTDDTQTRHEGEHCGHTEQLTDRSVHACTAGTGTGTGNATLTTAQAQAFCEECDTLTTVPPPRTAMGTGQAGHAVRGSLVAREADNGVLRQPQLVTNMTIESN